MVSCWVESAARAKASRRASSRSSLSRNGGWRCESRGSRPGGCRKTRRGAEEEVGFGDFETVGSAHHGVEAGAGDVVLGGH